MKQILVTSKKYGNFNALVDDNDFDRVNQYRWYLFRDKYNDYAVGRLIVNRIKRKVLMHRFILNILDSLILCDHKDGNGLNNKRNNIRVATKLQNNRNVKTNNRNSTGYKGVHYNKINKKFIARVASGTERLYLGSFDNKEDAARAYNEYALKHHGEFARLNIIPEIYNSSIGFPYDKNDTV